MAPIVATLLMGLAAKVGGDIVSHVAKRMWPTRATPLSAAENFSALMARSTGPSTPAGASAAPAAAAAPARTPSDVGARLAMEHAAKIRAFAAPEAP